MTSRINSIGWMSIALFLFSACGGGGGDTTTSSTTESLSVSSDDTENTVVASDDNASPVFISSAMVTMRENSVNVQTVEAEDDSSVQYSISGGSDGALFNIDATDGILRFLEAPDYESPKDSDRDNLYELYVTATDAVGYTTEQLLQVTVTDIEEDATGDSDGDMIPDNIEILLGMDIGNADENGNGITDGLDTSGIYGDTFFDKLWHLRSLGTVTNASGVPTIVGNDLNVIDLYHTYMGYNRGENIIVQVVDTGVDTLHEDLAANMDLSRSYDGNVVGDPSGTDTHGTMVAGIMAARAFNGKGVRGIVPFAKLAASNWLANQTLESLTTAWLTGEGANEIAVSNNSWGSYFDTDTEYEDIMALGTAQLRDGKGRLYVFAAGNDRTTDGNANLQYVLSNRYAIAVAGLKHDNTYADYSSPGANILVSGYSGNYYQDSPTIGTTAITGSSSNTGNINTQTTWEEDISESYTFTASGTSAASPMVSGVIALVLEACPALTWRDTKYLIATEAIQVDTANPSWVTTGSGLHFSTDYGFGLINAEGMISECTGGYALLPEERSTLVEITPNTLVPDDDTEYRFTLNVTDSFKTEWVEVVIDNDSPSAADYRITLTSPAGTKVTLITEKSRTDGSWMNGGFRFSTPAMMDEESSGEWVVGIRDAWSDDEGTLKRVSMTIYGH